MSKLFSVLLVLIIVSFAGVFYTHQDKTSLPNPILQTQPGPTPAQTDTLQITEMRKKSYPGSDLVIEQTLSGKTLG